MIELYTFFKQIYSIKGLSFGSKITPKNLKTVECTSFFVRLASFGQIGLISDHQISSKLQNEIFLL